MKPQRPILCRRANRGVAAVEFALVASLLLLLLAGVSEFGRAMYQYNNLVKGVGSATRYLSHYAPGDAAAISNARNLVVYGQLSASSSPVVAGLTTARVSICDSSSCPNTHRAQSAAGTTSYRLNLVTVTVADVGFTSLFGALVPSFNFGTISATLPQGS